MIRPSAINCFGWNLFSDRYNNAKYAVIRSVISGVCRDCTLIKVSWMFHEGSVAQEKIARIAAFLTWDGIFSRNTASHDYYIHIPCTFFMQCTPCMLACHTVLPLFFKISSITVTRYNRTYNCCGKYWKLLYLYVCISFFSICIFFLHF